MKLFILHFRPLENYPPIQNLLSFLNQTSSIVQVHCLSTKGRFDKFSVGSKIKIYRFGEVSSSKFDLWLSYLLYNLLSTLLLFLHRPSKVIYFESLSSYPIYLYKNFINKNADIYIHYHEYTAKEEYQNASFTERFFHSLEKKIYRKAKWISHTNEVRLSKFLKDEVIQYNEKIHYTMPNYPSKRWAKYNTPYSDSEPLKIIYVGHSLTPKNTYIEEVIRLLSQQSGIKIVLNIYCMKRNKYLDSINKMERGKLTVNVFPALDYFTLPRMLSQHHVGLILYKATSENVIHCAPNKLFEYLSCGLNVWYPKEMKGIHGYDTKKSPKVVRLDFSNLNQYSLDKLLEELDEKENRKYYAEEIYSYFLSKLKKGRE